MTNVQPNYAHYTHMGHKKKCSKITFTINNSQNCLTLTNNFTTNHHKTPRNNSCTYTGATQSNAVEKPSFTEFQGLSHPPAKRNPRAKSVLYYISIYIHADTLHRSDRRVPTHLLTRRGQKSRQLHGAEIEDRRLMILGPSKVARLYLSLGVIIRSPVSERQEKVLPLSSSSS